MAFPKRLLHGDEELILDLHPHWWFLAGPSVAVVLTVAVATALASRDFNQYVQLAVAGVAIVAVLWLVGRYARWSSIHFVVTTDRVIHRSGLLIKHGVEIPLERVNTVFFRQTLWERLLRSGDLMIESGGERGQQSFTDIRAPAHVQNEIYLQMEDNQRRMAGGDRAGSSVAHQIEKLAELADRGILSQAEFEDQKAKLLSAP